ncbi:WbuC family cupin fold metalloprotein [Escherichia coli]|uniref:WbuC family cupin fold metalloprotein n=1 Tax=Escherichia coli TaxID=562 RepID=UPI003A97E911
MRKRAHYLLHQSYEEKVQRLLIAFLENSYVEPHFHKNSNQWEMFIVIKGVFELTKYSGRRFYY